jgi:hypothetical protein
MNGVGGRLAAGRTADHHEGYRPSRVCVTEEPQPDDGPGSFRMRMRMARDGGDPRLLGWVTRMEIHFVMSGRNKALHLAGRGRERTLIRQAKGGILYMEQRSGGQQRHSPDWDLHGQCHPVPRTIDGIDSEEKSWELGAGTRPFGTSEGSFQCDRQRFKAGQHVQLQSDQQSRRSCSDPARMHFLSLVSMISAT